MSVISSGLESSRSKSNFKLSIPFGRSQHFHNVRITMIKENSLLRVQGRYLIHILPGQLEVENIEVFSHTLFANRLWNRHDCPLHQPAQNNLCHAFPVACSNGQ